MVEKIDTAVVRLWGHEMGAVSWLEDRGCAVFEYAPAFLKQGLDVSPIHMGLAAARHGDGLFSFPGQNCDTFLGLPGMLADALPDKFGNRLIDVWLARQGRDTDSFSPVERLCYTGQRAMGALEFTPAVNTHLDRAAPVEIAELATLVQTVMSQRSDLDVQLGTDRADGEAIRDILRVGTSAGGARPKAVIAMNTEGRVVSGQAGTPPGYDYWLLKFDGVDDLELGEPKGYGRIEYAYHRMATAAGISMTECRLLEEDGRAHFLTRRFDRVEGCKLHMQSLCGLAHYDFNASGAYGYEQAFAIMRRLRLSKAEAVQQYRRMLFNIIARNQDDHTKNIAFLMGSDGQWRLSPAFDITYSHNPAGRWTNQHQMSLNGKRDGFTHADLLTVGESIGIPRPSQIIDEVSTAVARWPDFAREAGVRKETSAEISRNHRLGLR
ncbi:MAG: type II toxin-antitoxin system HipA family toxin [Gammaproteobacteria bacterium]|nr:type II toxin-antitoxin system HipA family toxin [Gammaproteobacteria bacterium]MCF6364127.1 type II toxin-antitoxin system HipA family toxin [Gammaproteobacteria bacterium]